MTALRTSAALVASVVLLAGAAALTVSAPDDDALQQPIPVAGGLGSRIVTRTAEVRADRVVEAERLDFGIGGPDSRTDGFWLTVDLTAGCRLTSCGFQGSVLRSGGRIFLPAVLAPVSRSFVELTGEPGLLYRTTAIFELPRSALAAGRAELVLQPSGDTDALDAAPVVSFRLPRTVEAVATVQDVQPIGVQR